MGMKASDTAILTFEDVLVPLANTVGQEGQGFRYQMLQFQVRDRVSVYYQRDASYTHQVPRVPDQGQHFHF
jgi:citronellyl-CoA dehydrogenase